MAESDNIHAMGALIGVAVLSRSTGNTLGQIDDLIVDPTQGMLLGLIVRTQDTARHVLEYLDISSFGPDAVMADNDDSVKPLEGNQLAYQPLAKQNLRGAKVVTEGGKLLGLVANLFVHLAPPPLVIYEIRESLIDKLLGRELFIPASFGLALSDNAERIIVPDETALNPAHTLEALANNLFATQASPGVTVSSRRPADEETLVRGESLEKP
jgi:uncharacterized protein YrrD